jgi:hypothetical protein
VYEDLPHCSPNDSILARTLASERVFLNPPWEFADEIGPYFKHFDVQRYNPLSPYSFYLSGLTSASSQRISSRKTFFTRMGLHTRKLTIKTHVQLANGQRVTSINVGDISFTVTHHMK